MKTVRSQDGTRVAFDRTGDGPPVILVGGAFQHRASGNPEPLKRWASVGVPTLVMVGGESPPYQQHAVRALMETLPEAQLRTLERQTHDAAPEIIGPVLDEFFAG